MGIWNSGMCFDDSAAFYSFPVIVTTILLGRHTMVLFTLVHTDLVRAAGFTAPDFPVFYNEMVGASAWAGDSEFRILT